jgi:hypothetical protein
VGPPVCPGADARAQWTHGVNVRRPLQNCDERAQTESSVDGLMLTLSIHSS